MPAVAMLNYGRGLMLTFEDRVQQLLGLASSNWSIEGVPDALSCVEEAFVDPLPLRVAERPGTHLRIKPHKVAVMDAQEGWSVGTQAIHIGPQGASFRLRGGARRVV
jgi:hypothetical protein